MSQSLDDIVAELNGQKFVMAVSEEDGKIFTTLPDEFYEIKNPADFYEVLRQFRDDFKPEDGATVNNEVYDAESAEHFMKNYTPRQLEVLYYLSLGTKINSISDIIDIKIRGQVTEIMKKYRSHSPDSTRRDVINSFRHAFPHLYQFPKKGPFELTDQEYDIARRTLEGETHEQTATVYGVSKSFINHCLIDIYDRFRDQLQENQNPKFVLGIYFDLGLFYSKSNPKE